MYHEIKQRNKFIKNPEGNKNVIFIQLREINILPTDYSLLWLIPTALSG